MYISFFHVLRITVAYSLYNTQNAHHYCNNHRHLLAPSSQTHHGYFEASMTLQTMHHCKCLEFWSYQEYFSNPMGPPSLLHYIFIAKSKFGHSHVALLCISWVKKQSRTNFSGPMHTASLRICCILKWSGTNSNEHGPMRTVSSHISWVLRSLRISCIQFGTGAHKDTFSWYFKTSNKDLYRDRTQMMTSLIFEDNPWDPIFYVILTVCFALVFTVVMVLHYLMCCFIRVDPLNLCAANRWSNDSLM